MPESLNIESITTLEGGMVSALDPRDIAGNAAARLINVETERSLAASRPPSRRLNVDLPTGRCNGMTWYEYADQDSLFIGIGGTLCRVPTLPETLAMQSYPLTLNNDPWYFQQAVKYLVVQDGTNTPLIFDPDLPAKVRLSLANATDKEVPAGTVMAYGHGRLFLVPTMLGGVANNSLSFVAGDITLPTDAHTALMFTETDYLAEGGAMSLPTKLGAITGMGITQAPNGSGQGPLVVFTPNGASSFAINAPRSQWASIDLSSVLFTSKGTYAHRSITGFNSDLFYRSTDGQRTMLASAAMLSGALVVTDNALSLPVADLFDGDTQAQQEAVYATTLDNRVYCLIGPTTASTGEVAYQGVLRCRTGEVAGGRMQGQYVYDGVWSFGPLVAIVAGQWQGRDVLFGLRKTSSGGNEIIVIDTDATPVEGDEVPVCRVETRAMDFLSKRHAIPLGYAIYNYIDVGFKDIQGHVKLEVFVKPHGYPYWMPAGITQFNAGFDVAQARERVRVDFEKTNIYFDPWTATPLDRGYRVELALQWTGWATLLEALAYASLQEHDPPRACEKTGLVVYDEHSGVPLSDFPN